MSTSSSSLRQAADLLDVTSTALDAISKLTKTTKDDEAANILHAISALVSTLLAGFADKVTPDEVKKHLDAFTQQLMSNDQAVDAEAHKRFDLPQVAK